MQTPESEPSRALQVCANCKVRKRKCDKALPQCSHCIKKHLVCSYSSPHPTPPPLSDDPPWYTSPNPPSHHLTPLSHPTILFLDPSLLLHTTSSLHPTPLQIPPHILSLLGPPSSILTTTTTYFSQIHPWLPIISRFRVYSIYLHLPLASHSSLALLFLALKLITTVPPKYPEDVRTPLYYATKHFYLEVESSGGLEVATLQAGLLIAVYEVGHGIYPGAWLSVGGCARYGVAMGIEGGGKGVMTLVEGEERRRVRWGIVILDRFVSIGSPGRPFAMPEPTLEDVLPSDDDAWDQGIVSPSPPATVSSPLTSHMSKFALLCQAARLLGQVLTYVATEGEREGETEVGAQLDRTLHSMLKVAMGVGEPDYDQITFIFSALVALYVPTFHLARTTPIPPERLARALSACKLITEREQLPDFMRAICPLTTREPRAMSPWGCFFAYQICGVYLRAEQRSEKEEGTIAFFKEAFETLGEGWRVAGVYLRMLEVQEAMRYG